MRYEDPQWIRNNHGLDRWRLSKRSVDDADESAEFEDFEDAAPLDQVPVMLNAEDGPSEDADDKLNGDGLLPLPLLSGDGLSEGPEVPVMNTEDIPLAYGVDDYEFEVGDEYLGAKPIAEPIAISEELCAANGLDCDAIHKLQASELKFVEEINIEKGKSGKLPKPDILFRELDLEPLDIVEQREAVVEGDMLHIVKDVPVPVRHVRPGDHYGDDIEIIPDDDHDGDDGEENEGEMQWNAE